MKFARYLGWIVQALVLGVLLFIAIANLISVGSGASIFRYQGF